MVKQVNVYFDDKEFEQLSKLKNEKSWHDFILELLQKPKKEEKEK